MTVADMIRFTAPLYPRWRRDLAEQYLRSFELPAARSVKALSRGMRSKLALLLALCRGAELLILDEPTTGLDLAMAEDVLQALVTHVAREETTVFFSSHQIGEVDQIADRVVIIHRGRTVVAGELDALRESYRCVHLVFDGEAPAHEFRAPGVVRVRREGRTLTVLSSAGAEPILDETRTLGPVSMDVAPKHRASGFLTRTSKENSQCAGIFDCSRSSCGCSYRHCRLLRVLPFHRGIGKERSRYPTWS